MTETAEREALAGFLARAIFLVGDEPARFGGKTQRIQFMGGSWPDHEVKMGGLNETALAQVIVEALNLNAQARALSEQGHA